MCSDPGHSALIAELSNAVYELGAHDYSKIPGTENCSTCKRKKTHPLHDTPSAIARRLTHG